MSASDKGPGGTIQGLRSRRAANWAVGAVLVTGLIASISYAVKVASTKEDAEWRKDDKILERHAIALRTSIAKVTALVVATTSFFAASQEVEAREFEIFTHPFFSEHEALQTVLWAPEVKPEERAEHMRQAAARGLTNYVVHDREVQPVAASKVVYPTWYATTRSGAESPLLGLDWKKWPNVHEAMDTARDTGEIVAAGPLEEPSIGDINPLTILVSPVFAKDTPARSSAERRAAIEGYIIAIEQPEIVMQQVAALKGNGENGLSLYLLDVTDDNNITHLLGHSQRAEHAADSGDSLSVQALAKLSRSETSHVKQIAIDGRSYRLIGIVVAPHSGWGWRAILAGISGALVSVLLAALVWLGMVRMNKGEVARLQAISESATDGIITGDDEGRITSFNTAAAAMFGTSARDILGKPVTTLIPERFREAEQKRFAKCRETGEDDAIGKGTVEFTALRADGSEFPVEVALGTWLEHGNQRSFAAVVRDSTARREMEAELIAAKEAAEAASKAKTEFLAKVSHELRTPLNAIVGLCDLLSATELSRQQRADLEQISRSADVLLRLVSDILDLSRVEFGKLELAENVFGLRALVEHSVQPFISRAQFKGLEVTYRVAPNVPDTFFGDSGRLQQILVNLMGNAVKFTARGEVVLNVKVARQHENRAELEFSVRDTGPGIAPEQREGIFELFMQGEAGAKLSEGVGLGLATAAQLVKLMKGRLWVESEVGKGSTFYFTIDVALAERSVAAEQMPAELKGVHVLIVDDNATSRQVLSEATQSFGMIPDAVADGTSGLERLRARVIDGERFQLVLIDLNLSDLNALQVAQDILKDASVPLIPIILLSSGADGEEEAEALEFGLSARLEKPVSPSKLLETIQQVLGIWGTPEEVQVEREPAKVPLRVLLAEDNPVNQVVTRRMLRQLGHKVDTVNNGAMALEAIGQEEYDLVLMDYDMPVMDGLEACKAIREREAESGSRVYVLGLTAYAAQADRDQLTEAGMDSVLTKPVRMDALAEALEAAMPAPGEAAPALRGEATEGEAAEGEAAEGEAAPRREAANDEVGNGHADEVGNGHADDVGNGHAADDKENERRAESSVVDIRMLAEQGGDATLELIGMLEKQLPQLESEIAAAIDEEQLDRLRLAAHTLKGSLALFGAERAVAAACHLEGIARAGSTEGAGDALVDLRMQLGSLRTALVPIKEDLVSMRIREQRQQEADGGDPKEAP